MERTTSFRNISVKLTAITLAIRLAKIIADKFTEPFRNISSVIDNHIEFSSLPFDIIENCT